MAHGQIFSGGDPSCIVTITGVELPPTIHGDTVCCWLRFLFLQCDGTPLVGVSIAANGHLLTTDATGVAWFEGDPHFTNGDTVDWTATYDDLIAGTLNWSGTVTISCPGINGVVVRIPVDNIITVTVYDGCASGNPPLAGALVSLDGQNGTTGSDGTVVFTNVPAGTQPIEVIATGNTTYDSTVTIACYGAQSLDVYLVCLHRCDLAVTVTGSNGLPIAGATVQVGTLTPVQTDATGKVTVHGIPNGSQVTTVTCFPRFANYTTTLTFAECPVSPTPTLAVALTPATGYTGATFSAYPLANTLYITDNVYGEAMISYSSGVWTGTLAASYPASACCATNSFTIQFTLHADGTLAVSYSGFLMLYALPPSYAPLSRICPGGTSLFVFTGITAEEVIVPVDCLGTPAFFLVWTAPGNGCPGPDDVLYPAGVVYSVLETA